MTYRDGQGQPSQRVVWPLALVYNDSCVTVLAWCCLREDFWMFCSDRIVALEPASASFRPRRVALLRRYAEIRQERRAERPSVQPAIP